MASLLDRLTGLSLPKGVCSMGEKAIGIIAEYNPFHNGHLYQLEAVKQLCGDKPVVAVMSGNFVQRGEPALLDKWKRTEAALRNGVDLVLELPTAFAVRSADYFAKGGVETLNATGVISHLCFGVETKNNQLDPEALAEYLNTKAAGDLMKAFMTDGNSYGAAWEKVAENWKPGAGQMLHGANNILGMTYRRALLRCHSQIEPLAIPRQGADHGDEELTRPYASATAIRSAIYRNTPSSDLAQVMPKASLELLNASEVFPDDPPSIKLLLAYKLASYNANDIYNTSSADNGFSFRLVNSKAALTGGWENFLNTVVNKRYSKTALKRLILQLLLEEERSFWNKTTSPAYIRVLGFNQRGRHLLRDMKEQAKLPVITKLGRLRPHANSETYNHLLAMDIRATDLYYLLQYKLGCYGKDFTTSPLTI